MSTLLAIALALFISTLIYFAGLSLWYFILILTTFPDVLRRFQEVHFGNIIRLINKDNQLPLTIITPAFNEEKRILNMIDSVMHSEYKNIQLIIVNDGSTDNTIGLLKKEFELYEIPYVVNEKVATCTVSHCYQSARYPNMMVLDKEQSPYNCAADAVNAGLNACQTPLMLTLDADTLLEPESISRLIFTFLSNNHCIAVSGSVYVVNGNKVEHGRVLEHRLPRGIATASQGVEYLYARAGMNAFGGAMCYPGAFSFFETEIIRDVGGFDTQNFAYDAEIIMKLHHWMRQHGYPYNMTHTASSYCWTEVPSTLSAYWKQRDKWQRGMLRSVMSHISMLFNPKYRTVGLLTYPMYILFEVLAPLVELTSYIMLLLLFVLGEIAFVPLLWLLILAWGVTSTLTLAMVFLDLLSFNKYRKKKEVLWTLSVSFYELLGFRQYRALCCTLATIKYMVNRLRKRPL